MLEESKRLQFQQAYLELGSTRGKNATPEGREELREIWIRNNGSAARWLIEQMRTETNIHVTTDISEILSMIGKSAINPILNELENNEPSEELIPLIDAITWIKMPSKTNARIRVTELVKSLIKNENYNIRDAAIRATRTLQDSEALEVLEAALLVEKTDLIDNIREEIDLVKIAKSFELEENNER